MQAALSHRCARTKWVAAILALLLLCIAACDARGASSSATQPSPQAVPPSPEELLPPKEAESDFAKEPPAMPSEPDMSVTPPSTGQGDGIIVQPPPSPDEAPPADATPKPETRAAQESPSHTRH